MSKRGLEARLRSLENDEKDAVEQWRAFLRGEPSPWPEDDG